MAEMQTREVLIVGGGLAGLSAAIYLGRALRNTLLIDSGKSMARWEPDVQNYLGFPDGIDGEELLHRGRRQAERYQVDLVSDEITEASRDTGGTFTLRGRQGAYFGKRLLLATGIFHIPPQLAGVDECLGHSLFFCKDCDGYRVQGKRVAIYGANNEAVEYALGMLVFSPTVVIVTNQHAIRWDATHAGWLKEYEIPVYTHPIAEVKFHDHQIDGLVLEGGDCVEVEVLFTTRGDVYYNQLARGLGAEVGPEGDIQVDQDQRTTVPGLYAAGCITPANCQLIIAAGQGATAAQAINRDLFEESLASHSLRRLRERQLQTEATVPPVTASPVEEAVH